MKLIIKFLSFIKKRNSIKQTIVLIATIAKKIWQHLKYYHESIYLFEKDFEVYLIAEKSNVSVVENISKLEQFIYKRSQEDKYCKYSVYKMDIEQRFKNGDWCYAFELQNEIVSVVFISNKKTYCSAINYTFIMPHNTIGVHDGYTLREYRGIGIYKKIYNYAFHDIYHKGYLKGWFWIMPHNYPTMLLHKKIGLENIIKIINFNQLWGMNWHTTRKVRLKMDDLIEIYQKKYKKI